MLWYCDDLENRSLKLLTKVAETEPGYAPVHYRLGQLLARTGNLEASKKAYERALAVDPDLVIAHRALGQLLLRLDDTDGALRHLELADAKAPSDGPVQAALAEVYMRQGDKMRAVAAGEKARQFADSLVLQDKWRAEVNAIAMTAERCLERGKGLCQSQQYSDAIVQLEIAEPHLSQIPEVQYYLAVAHFGLGNRDQAMGYLDTMLQLMKDDPATAHDAIGALYLTFNSLNDAITHFEQAIQLTPENSSLHYRLAIALRRADELRSPRLHSIAAQKSRRRILRHTSPWRPRCYSSAPRLQRRACPTRSSNFVRPWRSIRRSQICSQALVAPRIEWPDRRSG